MAESQQCKYQIYCGMEYLYVGSCTSQTCGLLQYPPSVMTDASEQAVCLSVCLHRHPGNSACAATISSNGSGPK